jgi:hypothetical protein
MIKNTSFRRTMGMAVAGALASTAWAQQSITSFGGVSYSQNFNNTLSPFSDNNGFGNALSSSGVNQSTLPTGWAMSENGSSLGGLYNVSSGGGLGSSDPDAGANLYSYGALNNAERALGSLRGGGNAANNIFGVLFQNNTGRTITQIYVQYRGEQWRQGNGAIGNFDRLDFSYNAGNPANLLAGTWTDFDNLDFRSAASPNPTGSDRALNGNLAANQRNIGGVGTFITGLTILNGETFGIRWRDSDSSGNDDGLAIDDLLVMVPETSSRAMVVGLGLLGLVAWQRRTAWLAK